ncbi:hypothetical protein ADK67_37390 [Saccharothrix sp. NRRL B-16348]|nr:hypothetical protein ADK67_37390 [Saccharothrix sp. NRRL B-16348]
MVLLRAIRNRPRQTCLIVPTVALALDLERRVRELTHEPTAFAYHAGLASEAKAELVRRVREGAQWLVITSPEAACTVLAGPLETSAAEGRLDLLAIDEAHIVAEWGDDFRPAFQSLAGLRRRMLDGAPDNRRPVTVMLTATLDDYGLETLRRLFPGDRELLISAQATRPEPAWWVSHCQSEEDKRLRFLELCRHLPRPLIVYTTLHTSARSTNTDTAFNWARSAGLRAVRKIAGNATAEQRREAARGLALGGDEDQDVDIVIATSAFGLGVDIPGVRGVVHLCVPESVDRLYQEVGRSGRDGKASASVVLWTDVDAEVARDLADAKLIGDRKAWKRWRSMSFGRRDGGLVQVDLTAATDDVTFPWSGMNRYWNLHTLNAMDRAGMIEVDWPVRPDVPVDAPEDEVQEIFAAHRESTAVRILQSDLGYEDRFRQRFREAQSRSRSSSAASSESAMAILNGLDKCVNRFLVDHYGLTTESGRLTAVRQCGGCPACRAAYEPPAVSTYPAVPLWDGVLSVDPQASLSTLAEAGRLCVWVDGTDPDAEAEVVKRFIAHGVTALVSPQQWSPVPGKTDRLWWEDRVVDKFGHGVDLRVPTLVRIQGDDPPPAEAALLLSKLSHGPLTVVLTTEDQPSPFDHRVLLRESWGPAYRADQVLRRL